MHASRVGRDVQYLDDSGVGTYYRAEFTCRYMRILSVRRPR